MTRSRLVFVAVIVVTLAIGWWMLEGDPDQPDRTDVLAVPAAGE